MSAYCWVVVGLGSDPCVLGWSLCFSDDAGRVAGGDGVVGDVFGADGDAAQNCCVGADGGTFFDEGGDDFPVGFGLQCATGSGGTGQQVVGEHDTMSDEDFVFDGDAFADKGVALDFAPGADEGVFLDFYEGADFGVVSDGAAIQIDEGV
jgi:hypothetical protein